LAASITLCSSFFTLSLIASFIVDWCSSLSIFSATSRYWCTLSIEDYSFASAIALITEELGDGVSGYLAGGTAVDSFFSSVTTAEAPPETYSLLGASKGWVSGPYAPLYTGCAITLCTTG